MVNEKQPVSTEDLAEWQEAVADVAPLAGEVKIPPPGADAFSLPRLRRRAGVGASEKQEKSMSQHPSLTPPASGGRNPLSGGKAIERGLLDRIAKGREPIDARLDLHGLTEAEAYQQFAGLIQRAYSGGMRTVLVITGKGRGGEGTLRRALRHWLEREELRGYISGCHTARPPHGGEGAWYLRIRVRT